MDRRFRILFPIYSYLNNMLMLFMDAMPTVIRNMVFHIILGRLGRGVHIDYGVYFRYPKKIFLGDGVSINKDCRFYASHAVKDAYIMIGNNAVIGPEVAFFSAGHDYKNIELPDTARSIVIEKNVWIGGRAIILPGVTVREGAVIGAGAVVTKDISPYTVAAGNPAREIKKR